MTEAEMGGGAVEGQQAWQQLAAILEGEWRVWAWPAPTIPLPVEMVFGDEVDWVAGDSREGETVVVPVDRSFDLSRLKLARIARLIAQIDGVVPEEFRNERGVEVTPLAPVAVTRKAARWHVSPGLSLVQRRLKGVYFEEVRGSQIELEGSAVLTPSEAWRLVGALIGARVLRRVLKQQLRRSAEAARAELGERVWRATLQEQSTLSAEAIRAMLGR